MNLRVSVVSYTLFSIKQKSEMDNWKKISKKVCKWTWLLEKTMFHLLHQAEMLDDN